MFAGGVTTVVNKNLMTYITVSCFLSSWQGGHMEVQQSKYPVLAAALSVK